PEAHAEYEPAPREVVEGRHLLGQDDRIALSDEGDAGAEPQALRDGGAGTEGDERIERPPVLVGEGAARRVGRAPAGRDVGVLGGARAGWKMVLAGYRPKPRGSVPSKGAARSGRDDMDTPEAHDPLLTPAEVAAMFRVNPKTVTRWARSGKITAIRTLGGHRR